MEDGSLEEEAGGELTEDATAEAATALAVPVYEGLTVESFCEACTGKLAGPHAGAEPIAI